MTAELHLPAPVAPWAPLLADHTSTVPVPWRLRARRDVVAQLNRLPQQSPVALVSSTPLSRGQLRRAAARAGVVIDHEYVVVPGLHSGRYVVEDHPDTMAVLWSNLASPPTRLRRATLLLTLLASIGRRRPAPWWALGAVSPRVATGRRS